MELQTISASILVAPLQPWNQHLPSLLGWDILSHFQLLTNQSTGTLHLERI